MNPVKIYDYLILCRDRIFDAVRQLTPEQWNQEFPMGMKRISTTLTHLFTAEWYYIERIEGRDVPPYAMWPIKEEDPPAFDVLEKLWREQAERVWSVIEAVQTSRDNSGGEGAVPLTGWDQKVTWLSFPDDTRQNKRYQITCTAGDLFTQLALHEMHHRAQVMAMLRQIGHAIIEDIDYNALMYDRIEMQT